MKNLKNVPEIRRMLNYHNVDNAMVPDAWYEKVVHHGFNWASPKSVDVVALLVVLKHHPEVTAKLLQLKDIVLLNNWLRVDYTSGYCNGNLGEFNMGLAKEFLTNQNKFLPLTLRQCSFCGFGFEANELLLYMVSKKAKFFTPHWKNYGKCSEEGFEAFDSIDKMEWWQKNYIIFGRSGASLMKALLDSIKENSGLPEIKRTEIEKGKPINDVYDIRHKTFSLKSDICFRF